MQDQRLSKSPETNLRRLASLESSPIKVLKQQWRALYGSEPPRRVSRELLTRAVAYRIQEQVYGGLKPSTRRLLFHLADVPWRRRYFEVTRDRREGPVERV